LIGFGEPYDEPVPLIFGHRGCSADAPENTLAAFRLLLERGVRGVELDVHQCATGEIVVSHDDTLTRTAGVDIDIRSSSLAEIRDHDVGRWFGPEYRGERVPLLSEVLELLRDQVYYDIEIKHYPRRGGRSDDRRPGSIERAVIELLKTHGVERRSLISSFDPRVVRTCRRIDPSLPGSVIYTNHPDMPWFLREGQGRWLAGANVMKPSYEQVDRSVVERHHRRGRRVIVWTIDSPAEANAAVRAGVDGIVSNRPDALLLDRQTAAEQ
jgi:glycerophosphoryl diester phosphodiesterase